jgi:hypothetical protein
MRNMCDVRWVESEDRAPNKRADDVSREVPHQTECADRGHRKGYEQEQVLEPN